MNKELKLIVAACERGGLTVTQRKRGGHYCASREGGPKYFFASTPSDKRALLNIRAALRRTFGIRA